MDTDAQAASGPIDDELRAAARDVLAGDGGGHVLQPWQAAYLIAVGEGREGVVPPGCGVGRAWLQARLDEALAARRSARPRG